ncbi:hypothetical protein ACNFIA_31550 [Pseudomonas sp. NY15437]|uniref:hypothetical protein n=1 Tax=Pseudomonas sp. NY15437 TaxID=3400360 RepID=UPI003A880C7F
MLYLSDVQPAYCPKCGKSMEPRLHGWEAQDRFYNAKQPFLCECGARYLLRENVVANVRISEHRDRPFRLIVTGHFANA